MTARVLTDIAMREGAAQKPAELEAFIAWLIDRDEPIRTVLEIGTLRGGTLAAWCALATDDAKIVSIDLPGGRWGGGYSEHDEDRIRSLARHGQTMTLIRGDSHAVLTICKVEEALGNDKVDLLFIDGDHTYAGCMEDFQDYSTLVATGGVIAFHDILEHPYVSDCEVDRVWAEVSPLYVREEFTDPGDHHPEWGQWGGIGALIK